MVNLNTDEYYRSGASYARLSWESTERAAADSAANDSDRSGPSPERSSLPASVGRTLQENCHLNWRSFFLAITLDNGEQVFFTGPDALERVDCAQMFDMDRFNRFMTHRDRASLSRQESVYSDTDGYNQPSMYPIQGDARRTRARRRQQRVSSGRRSATAADNEPIVVPSVRRGLRIGDSQVVWQYYFDAFTILQQLACKVIAKVFVKAVAPKKQTTNPYTGGDSTAPSWWPRPYGPQPGERVRHKEPDHLYKKERTQLCAHILRLVTDPIDRQHEGIRAVEMTVGKLEKLTMDAMSTFFSDTSNTRNAAKKGLLKEIFRVAKQEENFKKGGIDDTTVVYVSTSKGAFDPDEDEDDEPLGPMSSSGESETGSGTYSTRMSPIRTPTSAFTSDLTSARPATHYGDAMELDSAHHNPHPHSHHHSQHHPYTLPAVGPLPTINTMQLDEMMTTNPSDAAGRRSSLYTSPPPGEYHHSASPSTQQVYSPASAWQSSAAPTATTLSSTNPGLYAFASGSQAGPGAYQPSYMSSYAAAQVGGNGGYSPPGSFRDTAGYPSLPLPMSGGRFGHSLGVTLKTEISEGGHGSAMRD